MTHAKALKIIVRAIETDENAREFHSDFSFDHEYLTEEIEALRIAEASVIRDIAIPPEPDKNAFDRSGKPLARCTNCGYVLTLQQERYCPYCGQRLVKNEEDDNGQFEE